MNNKPANIWSLFIFLLLSIPTFGQPVSIDEALKRARQFLISKGHSQSANALATMPSKTRSQGAYNPYYVFNISEEQGFVIVSGDDRTPEVLGYSERGTFDADSLPPNLEELLQGYADQISYLQENNIQVRKKASTRSGMDPIAPMIQTKWSQRSPYNDDLPEYGGERCLTGCVATAMAQIMYYHQYPKDQTAAIPSYTSQTLQLYVEELPATMFDWDHITPTYSSSSSAEEKSAVAHLMKYCATALQADFGVESTPAAFISDPLYQYFGYSENIKTLNRVSFNNEVWNNILYFELANGRPVMYSGEGSGDGHAFILDGCDEDGRYSVNWGWGGSFDGFFFLEAMTPAEDRNYSYRQWAIIGISPYDVATYGPIDINGIGYYLLNNHTALVASCDKSYQGDIVIPENVEYEGEKYLVTSIENYAFELCNELKNVSLPNSIVSIGDCAFWFCSGLTSIHLSEGLVSIGNQAFYCCNSLTSINLPEGLVSIGDQAFLGCSGLTSIHIPSSVTSIYGAAFTTSDNLETITVEEGNLYYDSRNNCNALIETNTNTLLLGCNNTVIPDDITAIGQLALADCTGLKELKLPDGLLSIGQEAFFNCSNLSSVYLPDGLQIIDCYAFNNCTSLTDITIPKSVTDIFYYPFAGCSNLESITVEDGNPYYDSRNNCNAIIKSEENYLINGCKNTVIPDDVQTIGSHAFYEFTNLNDIVIPDGVQTIESQAFYGCTGLKTIVIPNSVTSVEDFCFFNCTHLESVKLSKSISCIGEVCFGKCFELKDFYCYSKDVPVADEDTFRDCPLETVTLHVPEYSLEAYKNTVPWSNFGHFETMSAEEVSIQAPLCPNAPTVIELYDLNGQRVSSLRKGIYIRNGQKVLVK